MTVDTIAILVHYIRCIFEIQILSRLQQLQELSYRKVILRQLRTQYTEGIYRHAYYRVTLKSRLRVTQVHLKRNHWIDHKRLSSSRVI